MGSRVWECVVWLLGTGGSLAAGCKGTTLVLSVLGICTRNRGKGFRFSGQRNGVWGRWGCRCHRPWGCRVDGSCLELPLPLLPARLEPARMFSRHVSAHELAR